MEFVIEPGLAFDREPQAGESVRFKDDFGRLHVSTARLTKAAVSIYLGREIPGWQELGLERDQQYKLFRDSEEIIKALPTANNIPLLSRHVGVTAKDHKPDVVIGATGSDAVFNFPWLENSLVIWADADIAKVEDGLKRSLSMSYSYQPDMTPGTFEGEAYQGVMRAIKFNHCAVVTDPRVEGAMIGDSKPAPLSIKECFIMPTEVLSRKALLVQGASLGYLQAKLAADAKPVDLSKAFAPITAANFKAAKPGLVAAITEATAGKLAKDAKLDDLATFLGAFDEMDPGEEKEKPKAEDEEEETEAEKEAREKKEKEAKDKKARDKKAKDKAAKDAENPFAKKDDDDKDKAEDMVSKTAMDAAIASGAKAVEDRVMARMKAAREAEQFVRPWVGELAVAMDSAEEILRAAAVSLKVPDAATIHPSARKALITLMPKPGTRQPTLASDARPRSSDAGAGFAARYPEAARIRVL